MHLRGKVMVAFIGCLGLLVLQAVIVGFFIFQQRSSSEAFENAVHANKTVDEISSVVSSVRSEISTLENIETFSAAISRTIVYTDELTQLFDAIEIVNNTINVSAKLRASINNAGATFLDEFNVLQQIDSKSFDPDELLDQVLFVDEALFDVKAQVDILKVEYGKYLEEKIAIQHDVKDKPIIAAVVVCLVASVVLLLYGWIFSNNLTRPIKRLALRLSAIAEGNIHQEPLIYSGSDELAQLSKAMNTTSASLAQMIGEIYKSTEAIKHVASDLSAVADKTRDNAEQQRSETLSVADTANQISDAMTNIADTVTDAAIIANDADKQAHKGKIVVEESVNTIIALISKVQETSVAISNIEAESGQIGSVLDVIRSIAEQTNLLALNAAIEAARAGEQGRGFAVVADEVRTLAKRTQDSTQQIQDMIEGFNRQTNIAVMTMKQGTEQAKISEEKAILAGQALEAITGAVSKISGMNERIANHANEHRNVAAEMKQSLEGIKATVEETVESSDLTMSRSGELQDQTQQLTALVGRFRL